MFLPIVCLYSVKCHHTVPLLYDCLVFCILNCLLGSLFSLHLFAIWLFVIYCIVSVSLSLFCICFWAIIRIYGHFNVWICCLKGRHCMCLSIMTCFCVSKVFILSKLLVIVLVCLVAFLSFCLSWSIRYCSAVMGFAFICLLSRIIICPIFVIHTECDQSFWLWLPLSMMVLHGSMVLSLNHYRRSYWNRVITSDSIIARISLLMSFPFCFIVVITVNYWLDAPYRAVEQQSCRTG